MLIIGKIWKKFNAFFRNYYLYIGLVSMFTVVVVAYLDFELKHYGHDLIYWKRVLEYCYNEMEHFPIILIVSVILIKIAILICIIIINSRTFHRLEERSQLEVKKRYADFLFMRLLAKLDKIEAKYQQSIKSRDNNHIDSIIMAHEEMQMTIHTFRKDARKLLAPNELEVSLPTEEVFGVTADDERLVRHSRFYHMNITADDELIKSLINP